MRKLVTLFACIIVLPLFGVEYQQTFLLPLDITSTPKHNLSVSIPKGLKSLQPLSQFSQKNGDIIEYIPQNESELQWSEIITVNKYIGRKISAINITNLIKSGITGKVKDVKILSQTSKKDKTIEQAKFIMSYTNQNKREVIGAWYLSGPYDAAGVQYTIRLKDGVKEDEAVKKINAFFDSSVSLLPF